MNSRADTSIHSMTITTLSLHRVSVSVLGSALLVVLTVPVFSDVTVRLPITSPSCLLSPCPSFQRSAARCCIMGKSRNLALRRSLRSWCWHRRCWRRSDAVSHSSPSGNLWTRRQMKPMNVGISNFWRPAHVCFHCGARRGHPVTGQSLVKATNSQYSVTEHLKWPQGVLQDNLTLYIETRNFKPRANLQLLRNC